jgi:hypothetical protein
MKVSCKIMKHINKEPEMQEQNKNIEDEISDLKWELEHFEQEKERVRTIIGKIGGMPKFRTKLMNTLFLTVIVVAAGISIFAGEKLRLLMVELTTVMLSLKIIYMIHVQERVNHFKFWILSAIEWRINEILTLLKKDQRKS